MAGWNVVRYKQRLRAFNVQKQTEKAVKEGAWQILEINKENLDKGLNSKDKLVGSYAIETEVWSKKPPIPNESKKAGSNYNFNWTGAFINGLYIEFRNDVIHFSSKGLGLSSKSFFIKTNELMGLSKKNAKIVNNEILAPRLQRYFKEHLGK